AVPGPARAPAVRQRAGDVHWLRALPGRLPGQRHHGPGGGERPGQSPLAGRTVRLRVAGRLAPVHLLRLLRGGVPHRRAPPHPGVRAGRRDPAEPGLGPGEAGLGPTDRHPRAGGGLPRVPGAPAPGGDPAGRPGAWGSMMVLFFLLGSLMAVAGASGVVVARKPVHGVIGMILNFLGLALLYVSLQAEFLAVVQIIVYAGAVMVLFLFVVALLTAHAKPPAMGPSPLR